MPGAICGILLRMETDPVDTLEINPATAPQASIIWLHGLGADGNDFAPLIPQLGIVDSLAVRVVLPHAPKRAVTINNGMLMRAWYDISAADFRAVEDGPGIRDSARLLDALVRREVEHGVPAGRILLAGFSQGGAMALHTGLRYPQRLGGILVLSAYLPLAASLPAERSVANSDIPIMLAHGEQDQVVPMPWAAKSRDYLQGLGYKVEWHDYPMAHAVCAGEIDDIRDWIVRLLSDNA